MLPTAAVASARRAMASTRMRRHACLAAMHLAQVASDPSALFTYPEPRNLYGCPDCPNPSHIFAVLLEFHLTPTFGSHMLLNSVRRDHGTLCTAVQAQAGVDRMCFKSDCSYAASELRRRSSQGPRQACCSVHQRVLGKEGRHHADSVQR